MAESLLEMSKWTEDNILGPGDCLPLPRGYIHVYDHNIETSSLANQLQTFCRASLGRGNESLYKWSRSHDQDGRQGYK